MKSVITSCIVFAAKKNHTQSDNANKAKPMVAYYRKFNKTTSVSDTSIPSLTDTVVTFKLPDTFPSLVSYV